MGSNRTYKIRRLSDGLYSRGGNPPTWSKAGKSWNGAGPLKQHLNQYLKLLGRTGGDNAYEGCVLEAYEVSLVSRKSIAIMPEPFVLEDTPGIQKYSSSGEWTPPPPETKTWVCYSGGGGEHEK